MNPYNVPPDEFETRTTYKPRYSREERQARRQRRRRARFIRRLTFFILLISIIAIFSFLFTEKAPEPSAPPQDEVQQPTPPPAVSLPVEVEEAEPAYVITTTVNTAQISDSFPSKYAILLDLESGEVLAERDSDVMINPASMTKILTLLVASENISDLSGTFTMTFDITDYCYVNKCSVVGYEVGEVIPVEELFYGCILNSGADACLALAEIAAGSHEAFVDLMNEKLEELGLSDTAHFTNCVGLYDEDHYCTVQDMALILKAALENEHCREVMGTKIYHTASTNEHPAGQDLSNWFIRRIEEQDTGVVDVRYAKTGYVSESGYCAASCGETESGQTFLCVTGKSTGTQQSIRDHAELYRTYCQLDSGNSTMAPET